MKHYLFIMAFFVLQEGFAQHIHYPDKPSTHGMMLLGSSTVYASHLPMFHTPHDYQIILSLQLSKEDQEKYEQDRRSNPAELIYTIEPEVFVLPEMVNETKKFKANIYRGHFERGGTMFLENIPVQIKEVVYFRKFKKNGNRPPNLRYILFGNKTEQFLAHLVSAKPDFDENIAVGISDKKIINSLKDKHFLLLEFNELEKRKPFSWKTNKAAVIGGKDEVIFNNHKVLYVEFDELN